MWAKEETLWPLFTKLALGEHGIGRVSMQLTRGSCISPHLKCSIEYHVRDMVYGTGGMRNGEL